MDWNDLLRKKSSITLIQINMNWMKGEILYNFQQKEFLNFLD